MKVLRRPARIDRGGGPPGHRAEATPTLIWLALTAVYVIWGSTYLSILLTVRTFPTFLSASIRFLIAGSCLYLWAIIRVDAESYLLVLLQLWMAHHVGL